MFRLVAPPDREFATHFGDSRILLPLQPVCHPALVDCAPPPAATVGLSIGVLLHGSASLMVSALSAHRPLSPAGAWVYSPTRIAYGPDLSLGMYLNTATKAESASTPRYYSLLSA